MKFSLDLLLYVTSDKPVFRSGLSAQVLPQNINNNKPVGESVPLFPLLYLKKKEEATEQ